ncbi:hypothetical protein HPB51_023781 [Rhipicephalus microplus]|uniref:Uncharacterized protein n=1 Tax=Rhipicephalus microplus TaxID=6941 RepID=A0A9J6E564_RHIMP|nr:hypothetical protein HPB51_023781 [Rhipicephalus microplus]
MERVLQFSALVWKNMYLRRLRVRPIAFLVEILMVTVPFIKIQNERGPRRQRRRPVKTITDEVAMAQLLFSKNVTPNTLGLYFHTESLGDDIPHDLTYTIMFSSGAYEIAKARKVVRENGPSQLEEPMSLRVAAVQSAVDLAHIHELEHRRYTNHTHEDVTVKLRQFPYPTYHEDTDNTMFLIALRLGVAYAWPFCLVITRAIEERQSGMQASDVPALTSSRKYHHNIHQTLRMVLPRLGRYFETIFSADQYKEYTVRIQSIYLSSLRCTLYREWRLN